MVKPVQRLSRGHVCWLLAATAVATALRFWCLADWSMWIDEAHSFRDATMRWSGEGSFLASNRSQYPSSFLLLRLLIGLGVIGFDEWSLRLPFALAGIASVPLLALCGRRLVGATAAVAAAWVLAVHPWHLFWSQNARAYALVLPCVLVAIASAQRWAATGRDRHLLLVLVALAAGISCHSTAALIAVGLLAWWGGARLLRARLRPRTLLLASPLVLVVAWVAVPWLIDTYAPFQDFLEAKRSPSLQHFVETSLFYFRPPLMLLAAVGVPFACARLDGRRAGLLVALLAVPLLVLAIVSAELVKVTARYGFVLLPVLCWLGGVTLTELLRLGRSTVGARALLAASVPLLLGVDLLRQDADYYSTQHGQRARWREAAQFLEREVGRRGLRGLRVLTVNRPSLVYYLEPQFWFVGGQDRYPDIDVHQLVEWELATGRMGDQEKTVLHEPGAAAHLAWNLARARPRDQLFAVVVTLPHLREKDPDGAFERLLEAELELALHLPCWVGPKDESVYVFLPRR